MTFTVDCSSGSPHLIELLPDWSLRTPHDLDVERVVLALGGVSSCVQLAESLPRALRDYLVTTRRSGPPALKRPPVLTWQQAAPAEGCCDSQVYEHASAATEDFCSPAHLRTAYGVDPEAFLAGRQALDDAWLEEGPVDAPCPRVAQGTCVEPKHLPALWEAGIHPDLVCRIHAIMEVDHPLDADFYLAAACLRPDLLWIRETAGAFPKADLHRWLAETETRLDRRVPSARLAWLRSGTLPSDIGPLSHCGYTVNDAAALADETATSIVGSIDLLRSWSDTTLRPSVDELLALRSSGYSGRPGLSNREVHRAIHLLCRERSLINATDFGLLGAVTQNADAAMLWALSGFRSILDVLRVIDTQVAYALPDDLSAATASLILWLRRRGLPLRRSSTAPLASVAKHLSDVHGHELPEDWRQADLARVIGVMAGDLPAGLTVTT